MFVEGVVSKRLELLGQLAAAGHGERGRHADVMQATAIVIQPEQQRSDQLVLAVLVPPESGDDAVGGARVLDLDHRALAWLIRAVERLRDHAIETGALESCQPLRRDSAIVRHRRQMDRRLRAAEQPLEAAAALALRDIAKVLAVHGQHIERDE